MARRSRNTRTKNVRFAVRAPRVCRFPASFTPFYGNILLTLQAGKQASQPYEHEMAADKIDNLDRKILKIVMKNARIPSKEIAAECGVSRAAIHQRIARLQEMQVIVGSGYTVDPQTLGYSTCTYMGVKLEKGNMYRDVVKDLDKIPEVVECHFTTGPYSILIKVHARDNTHLMKLLNDHIQKIDGVKETETMISLEQSIRRQIEVHLEEGEEG